MEVPFWLTSVKRERYPEVEARPKQPGSQIGSQDSHPPLQNANSGPDQEVELGSPESFDKAVSKGVLKANTGSRYKSRLAALI